MVSATFPERRAYTYTWSHRSKQKVPGKLVPAIWKTWRSTPRYSDKTVNYIAAWNEKMARSGRIRFQNSPLVTATAKCSQCCPRDRYKLWTESESQMQWRLRVVGERITRLRWTVASPETQAVAVHHLAKTTGIARLSSFTGRFLWRHYNMRIFNKCPTTSFFVVHCSCYFADLSSHHRR